jgi:predicted ATPase
VNNIQVTVKNYRCFDDANPLRITIKNGFVALVGPNNSGKSSCLKLFYELRLLWEHLASGQIFRADFGGCFGSNINYLGVQDPEEIFSNTNNRALTIEITIGDLSPSATGHANVSFVRAICERSSMNAWKVEFLYGEHQVPFANGVNIATSGIGDKQSNILTIGSSVFDYSNMASIMRDLTQMFYIGPFRNAITEGTANYFDLDIGTRFISIWNQWKTGGIKAQSRAIESITADIRQIFEYESLEINASEQLKTLVSSINGKSYRLPELGAGLAQFIIVLGNAAIKKPSFILVDEPELHLHPSLQIDFLTSLASYAKSGIIFATHSIGLARTTSEDIYSFQKKEGRTIVRIFEQTPNYAEFIGELSFSAFKEMGCDCILLVEGVTDVKTIQQFLRKLKKDHRIVVLPLGGDQLAKGGVEQELAEIKRLTSNISALVDSERTAEGANAAKQRDAFAVTCSKLGFDVLLTNRRAIENYFSDEALKAEFGEKYKSLGHFEKLEECELPWNKKDNWKVARKMKLDEIKDTDVGKFLEKL